MRFLTDLEFAAMAPIGSKVTCWRKRKSKPRRLPLQAEFGPRRKVTPEPVAKRYLEAIATGHSEEEATRIAEDFLTQLRENTAAT